MPTTYYDGDYAAGFYDGPPVITYPFINNTTPDKYAKQIRRTWLQRGVDYAPTNADRTSYANLMLWSEDLSVSPWASAGSISIVANATTAPDGSATADSVEDNDGVNSSGRYQYITVANDSVTRTASVFVKRGDGVTGKIRFSYENGTPLIADATITWATGAIVHSGSGSSSVVDCGYGWFRVSVTLANNSSGNTQAVLIVYPETSNPGAGSTCYAWGAQIVVGSVAGPYVSTTAATRSVSSPNLDPGDDVNDADPLAYLVAEAEQSRDLADTVKVSRLFSRIPATQTRPTSLRISKPSISGTFPQAFGDYRIFQPQTSLQVFDAYRAQTVTSDSGIPSFYPTGGTYTLTFAGATTGAIPYNHSAAQVEAELDALTPIINRGGCAVTGSYNSSGGFVVTLASYSAATFNLASLTGSGGSSSTVRTSNGGYNQSPEFTAITTPWSGGTFTLTIFAQTTAAIAYNASAATVQTALNALSEVSNRGGCTVMLPTGYTSILSSDGFTIAFSFAFSNAIITANVSSLTPTGSTATPVLTEATGRIQTITFTAGPTSTRTLYCAAHGITEGEPIFIKGGGSYYSNITNYILPDANTIVLEITSSLSYASVGGITETGKRTKSDYSPGSGTIAANSVTSFYLPGVTSGITTAADIPQPQDQGDQTPFLLATFAGTGTINMTVGQLQPWNGTTILSQELTTINAADV